MNNLKMSKKQVHFPSRAGVKPGRKEMKMKIIINTTPHPIRFQESAHVFVGEYSSTNPCLRCGAWQDEAQDVPCIYEVPPYDTLYALSRQ